jgi:threonine dehydrogenase-like Zn-dependent dehydrogenase
MKALYFDGSLRMTDMPDPKPEAGEALVKVVMAGICKTDVEITKGYMGFTGVPGHELIGVVEESPAPELIGKRVVGEINVGCGECSLCRAGMERHCPNRDVLGILGRNGALAEYLTLPPANLEPVPDNLPDEKAIFTEPLAAALEILEQVKIEPSHNVLIIGDGKLGLLIAMSLRLTGASLLLSGKHSDKSAIFTALGGKVIHPDDLADTDEKFDVVVEASGNPTGWKTAVERVKPRGVIVLKSTYAASFEYNPAPLVIDEITVVGSRCGRFAPALRLMDMGLIDPSPLLSKVFPFERAEEAFEAAQLSGNLKIALKM